MTARDDLLREMTHNHLYMTDERAEQLVDAAITEALTDPGQHDRVVAILQREARMHPDWLRDFRRKQDRIEGRRPLD